MFGWGRRGKNTVFLYFGIVLGLSRFVKLNTPLPGGPGGGGGSSQPLGPKALTRVSYVLRPLW